MKQGLIRGSTKITLKKNGWKCIEEENIEKKKELKRLLATWLWEESDKNHKCQLNERFPILSS